MYLMENKQRGLSDRSVEGLRSVLSSFFGWLWKEGLIRSNPCANVSTIKYKKQIRLPYSPVELELIKRACRTPRDIALVSVLRSTGARISEICDLNRGDIDLELREGTVLGKGNKERTVYLDEIAAAELKAYLETRTDDHPALFTGKGTERMTPHGVRFFLKTIEKRSGVPNVHPHRFRRTLATSLILHGMPIQEVAIILGHENINTTMTYVHIDKVNVKASYSKYMG